MTTTMRRFAPKGGYRSLPGGTPVLAARLRLLTHRRVRQRWGAQPERLAVLVSTAERYVFETRRPDGQVVFVKARGREGALEAEARALQLLDGTDIAPVLTDRLPGDPDVLATALVEGTEPRAIGEAGWVAAGSVLRRLHEAAPPEGITAEIPAEQWGSDRASQLRQLAADAVAERLVGPEVLGTADVAATTLEQHPPAELTLVHGDCQARHVRIDPGGRARLLDFDAVRLGDPRFDLAVLTTFDPERLPAVLDGYGMASTDELQLVIRAQQVFRLVKALHWERANGIDSAHCLVRLRELQRLMPA